MKTQLWKAGSIAAGLMLAGIAFAGPVQVKLSGDQEVPPVTTSGSGSGTINVADDGTVSGSVMTTGVPGTMAHIHEGAPGKNGGVVIPLTKKGDNEWAVPAGAKLNDAQMKAFKEGHLYVNVHTEKNKGGEVRGQMKP
jgi:hypothetical protein